MPLQLTLKQLAEVALGGPEFTSVNMALLQTLLNILLNKLNCADEQINLTNTDESLMNCLKYLFEKAKMSPIPVDDENITLNFNYLATLGTLSELLQDIEAQLDDHLKDDFELKHCNDLCTIGIKEAENACKLLKNTDAVRDILDVSFGPAFKLMQTIDVKLQELESTYEHMINNQRLSFYKATFVEDLMMYYINLETQLGEYTAKFLHTMQEMQDIFDAKVDNFSIHSMKHYAIGKFQQIADKIEQIEIQAKRPRAAAVLLETPETKPTQKPKEINETNPKYHCGCYFCRIQRLEPTLSHRMRILEGKTVQQRITASQVGGIHILKIQTGSNASEIDLQSLRKILSNPY